MPRKKIDVVLRDLDSLLREKLGNGVIVESFKTSSLVPPGENYGSTMLRVEAVVRRDGAESEPEELSLVAKMTPPTEFQTIMFDCPFTFPKEIYMFTDIVPAYKALERESGVPEDEVFDLLPELYGSRLSLKEGKGEFDHDAVILMENLKLKNYECGDRMSGVDMEHAIPVVEALARFHGLGIAMKFKKPQVFAEFKNRAKFGVVDENVMRKAWESMVKEAERIPELLPHVTRVKYVVPSGNSKFWINAPEEPWGTITHTDFWTNNFMVRHDASGNAKRIKFVDFQNYRYQNPMQDLVFFMFSSCKKYVVDDHMQDLVDLYYNKLTSHLARLDCDLIPFSRESFDKQFAKAANCEFAHCGRMIRIITASPETDPGVDDFEKMFDGESSDVFRERMRDITLRFVEENWI